MSSDLFGGNGIRVKLKKPEDFLKIKETLTRIGIAAKDSYVLYQSCHILHKQGNYAIMHFKEMFKLDGKTSSLTEEDIKRRNKIVDLLQQWNLVDVEPGQDLTEQVSVKQIKIVPFKEKDKWSLQAKYQIGKK